MSTPTQIEISKNTLSHAEGLVRWAFLLNGASAAGLLTFLGNSIEKQSAFANWSRFSDAMLSFVAGLLLAVASRAATFLALNYFAQIKEPQSNATPDELRIYLLVGDRAVIFSLVALHLSSPLVSLLA